MFPNGAETYADTKDAYNICTSRIQMDGGLLMNIQHCDNIVFPWLLSQNPFQHYAANKAKWNANCLKLHHDIILGP